MAPFFLGLGITLLVGFSFIAVILHFSHKKEDRIAVDMPLASAFLWFNTAASLSIELNLDLPDGNRIFKYMAGLENPYETSINQALRQALSSAWGIVDAQTAEENMENLLKNGMRRSYNDDMELLLFKYGNLSEQQLIDLVPDSNEDSFLPKMIMAYRRIGKNAILGWDIGRLCYYAQICCFVGYISKEKMLKLCTKGGKMAQCSSKKACSLHLCRERAF